MCGLSREFRVVTRRGPFLYEFSTADTSIMSTRVTLYAWSIFFLLMSQNLLFIYEKRAGLAILLGIWIAQAMSLFAVEVTLPFFLLSPGLLWFQSGKFTRKLANLAFLLSI